MGNLNINTTAKERLDEMAKNEDRKPSQMASHLINEAWRGRKGYKTESEVK